MACKLTDIDHSRSRILLTSGEPAGIGPSLCVMIAQAAQDYPLTVMGDPTLLKERAEQLKLPLELLPANELPANEKSNATNQVKTPAGCLYLEPMQIQSPVQAGVLNPDNAEYVLSMLRKAARYCMNNHYSAVVTLPVQKSVINDAGIHFSGHTEFFADEAGKEKVVMMLATDTLRVALVTTHLPLHQVPKAITKANILQTIEILVAGLKNQYGIQQPRILVAGLNPHAGENGHLGREEVETIIPALEELKLKGFNLSGPLPADTLFTPKYLKQADAVLCMYHDQGLPTLKYAGFGNAANITLGLPFIRTSVDHGTALDLATSTQIDSGSLTFAIEEALQMSLHTLRPNSP